MTTQYTTHDAAQAHRPDHYVFDISDVAPEMAYLEHTTRRATVEGDAPAVRVGIVDDDSAQHVLEGDTIPLSQANLDERLIFTRRIAYLTHISRDQYRQAGTDNELAESVRRAMVRKADEALFAQPAPVSPEVAPSTGLVHLPGAVRADITTDLDPLHDMFAELEDNGADPSVILVSPQTWAAFKKLKIASDSNAYLLGAGTTDTERRMLSTRVVTNRSIPAGEGVVVDPRAITSGYGSLEISTSEHALFDSVGVAIRALFRAGHCVPREGRVGVFYLPASARAFKVDLGEATGGTFTLTFRGRTTSALAYNATASVVKDALAALDDGFDGTDWTVTLANGVYTVTTPGGTLTGSGASLTGGDGLTVEPAA